MCKAVIFFLGFLFAVTILAPAQAAEKKAWGDRDPFRIKDVHSLRLSPLGDQLAFVVSERNVAKNENYSSIWVLPTRGGSHSFLRINGHPHSGFRRPS
jgi:hypothetical protein